jgi:hypothetical protein
VSAPTRVSELSPPPLLRWGRRLGWAWLALVTGAAVLVVARRSHPVTPAFSAPAPVVAAGAAIDLARFDLGARLEVSSYLSTASHHPIFAIDGAGGADRQLDPLLKWVSATSDHAPWLIVRWPWPVDLDEVRLVHAGRFEHGDYTNRDFTIACLGADDAPLASTSVRDNREPISRHPLACQGATALRVDFAVEAAKESARAVVRLYELEALGRPHRAPAGAP